MKTRVASILLLLTLPFFAYASTDEITLKVLKGEVPIEVFQEVFASPEEYPILTFLYDEEVFITGTCQNIEEAGLSCSEPVVETIPLVFSIGDNQYTNAIVEAHQTNRALQLEAYELRNTLEQIDQTYNAEAFKEAEKKLSLAERKLQSSNEQLELLSTSIEKQESTIASQLKTIKEQGEFLDDSRQVHENLLIDAQEKDAQIGVLTASAGTLGAGVLFFGGYVVTGFIRKRKYKTKEKNDHQVQVISKSDTHVTLRLPNVLSDEEHRRQGDLGVPLAKKYGVKTITLPIMTPPKNSPEGTFVRPPGTNKAQKLPETSREHGAMLKILGKPDVIEAFKQESAVQKKWFWQRK